MLVKNASYEYVDDLSEKYLNFITPSFCNLFEVNSKDDE